MALWQLPATALSSMLSRGETSSREILLAHLDRIGRTDGRIHAFTEVLKDRAFDDADASDARRRRGESRGPLDGLPVTFQTTARPRRHTSTSGVPPP